jgi:hypothetical protein
MTAWVPRCALLATLFLVGVSVVQAQRHREPLTQPEIDQIRDASWEPKTIGAVRGVCPRSPSEARADEE